MDRLPDRRAVDCGGSWKRRHDDRLRQLERRDPDRQLASAGRQQRQQVAPVAASAPKSGFETSISVPGKPAYVAVQALSAEGNLLGTSHAIKG